MLNKMPKELVRYIKSYLIHDKCHYCNQMIYRTAECNAYPLICNYTCYLKFCVNDFQLIINIIIISFFINEMYNKSMIHH